LPESRSGLWVGTASFLAKTANNTIDRHTARIYGSIDCGA
jgi:hypothetical protein